MNDQNFPVLTCALFLPLAGAVLALLARNRAQIAHGIGIVTSMVTLYLLAAVGARGIPAGFSQVEEAVWIPSLQVAYRVGIDGISYPIVAMTALLFCCSFAYSAKIKRQPGAFVALGLLLETSCLGVFMALDLLLFYVFFEVSLVGMYFIIAQWGHEGRKRAALQFFIYTLVGSLLLLLAFISLYLHSEPRTFDLRELVAQPPNLDGLAATLTFWALIVGFAIKTPVFPFHSWLPAAHTEAPAAGSAILAGVLLKFGAYGFIRFALQMMPASFAAFGEIIMVVAVVSAIYGALVAFAQTDIKRMVAYTSVNHMGYFVFGVAAAAVAADSETRAIALTGSTLQMVSHGVVTGMLFLIIGAISERTGTRELSSMNGLLRSYPILSGLFALGAFASLGLPGLAHFPAEFQIFVGGFGVSGAAVAFILVGLALTAALYLRALQSSFLGEGKEGTLKPDLNAREAWAIVPLGALAIGIGVFPGAIISWIQQTADLIAL